MKMKRRATKHRNLTVTSKMALCDGSWRRGLMCAMVVFCAIASQGIGLAEEKPKTEAGNAANASQVTVGEIRVEGKRWEAIQAWVKTQKGKVVVIDAWSTWCPECVREFPHFVAMHHEVKDGLVCASMSLDFIGDTDEVPDDVREPVLEFLKKQKADMPNFISTDGDEATMKLIRVASIPASLVFDQQGELKKVFKNDDQEYGSKGFNYADHVRPFVMELLKR